MGWNSWNRFACGINETLIRATADVLSAKFLPYGFTYLNLDDCWQVFHRSCRALAPRATCLALQLSRDSQGNIQPDPHAFPSGMKALADYVRSKGLSFGLYSDAGTATCQGRPGSLHYEVQDANSYASVCCCMLESNHELVMCSGE